MPPKAFRKLVFAYSCSCCSVVACYRAPLYVGDAGVDKQVDGAPEPRIREARFSTPMRRVFGIGDALWAVGGFDAAAAFRRERGAWVSMPMPQVPALSALWASSSTNIVAVGSKLALLRYDGTAWAVELSPTAEVATLTSPRGSSSPCSRSSSSGDPGGTARV